MKLFRLHTIVLIILLVFVAGLVLAQDTPPELATPTQPLHPCPTKVTATTVCDMIATQPQDIVGVWSVYFGAEPAFIRYNMDGTWVLGDTAESTAAEFVEGYASGIYSFDENIFTSTGTLPTTLPQECRTAQYILHVIKIGGEPVALNHAAIEDCFAPRRLDWSFTMLRVSGQ